MTDTTTELDPYDPETAAEFLDSRANWLRVEAVDRPDGRWDVVLRIDGTYSASVAGGDDIPGGKDEVVRYFQRWLIGVFRAEGISPDRLHDWAQPVDQAVARS